MNKSLTAQTVGENVRGAPSAQRSQIGSSANAQRAEPQADLVKKEAHGKFLRPVPMSIKPLLRLANSLPVQFRYPHWARRETKVEDLLSNSPNERYRLYELDLFRSSRLAGESSDQWRLSCQLFLRAIECLPLELRAFILEDRDGEVVEVNGHSGPLRDLVPPPSDYNFELLDKSVGELEEIIQKATRRYEIAFDLEAEWALDDKRFFLVVNRLGEGRSTKLGDRSYCHTYSHVLLRRAHQRLIYAVAAQETLICLTREDAQEQLQRRVISSLYEGQSTLHIIQEGEDKGKLKQFESALERPFVGIEVFDYDGAAKTGRKPNRIRVCPICYRIFWAGRLDTEHCGEKKCKSTFSTRLSRNPELRELYNKARRTKRAKAKTQQTGKKGK